MLKGMMQLENWTLGLNWYRWVVCMRGKGLLQHCAETVFEQKPMQQQLSMLKGVDQRHIWNLGLNWYRCVSLCDMWLLQSRPATRFVVK